MSPDYFIPLTKCTSQPYVKGTDGDREGGDADETYGDDDFEFDGDGVSAGGAHAHDGTNKENQRARNPHGKLAIAKMRHHRDPNWYIVATADGWHMEVMAMDLVRPRKLPMQDMFVDDDEARPAEEILAEREKWWQRDWKATMVPPLPDESGDAQDDKGGEAKEESAAVVSAREALEAATATLASLADDATDDEKTEAQEAKVLEATP